MKDLKDIILNGEQVYEYRLKFAFDPEGKNVERVKSILEKYDLVDMSPVKRTIFQSRPLDFYNLDCGEIYIIDASTKRPIQDAVLLSDLCSSMCCSESLVRVRNKNSVYQDEMAQQEDDLQLDEYIVKMNDKDYTDAPTINVDDFMGDKLADKVVDAAKADYSKERTPYADYMIAGYEAMYPRAKSDVTKDAGPRKE